MTPVGVYSQSGHTPTFLFFYADRPGGITLSDCAELSRHISVILDVEDRIPGRYVLEVSSPGIERPLFSERDYERFKGQEIKLATTEKIENRRNFTGTIEEFRDGVVTLRCDKDVYEIPFGMIKKSNLVYHFE
ncbi:MAG: ribosome maturation factor RimP [Acidobacteriota bacterium]